MPDFVIADTSVLILLDNINQLQILPQLYPFIYATPEIQQEFGKQLPNWIKIHGVSNKESLTILKSKVDIGEASAIALALENKNVLLILDDLKARKIAKNLNLKFTGTLGVLSKAKERGVIEEIRPLIDDLMNIDFRITNNILREVLRRNNEL